jgi:hypothetical protein
MKVLAALAVSATIAGIVTLFGTSDDPNATSFWPVFFGLVILSFIALTFSKR